MTGYGSGAYGSGPYGGDTTPGGLPTVHVLLDDGTGTFPYDLTHLDDGTGTFKSYVLLPEGFSFNRGRQDWQGGVTAGSLSLVLNNADGRFTPGSTIIGKPSPIKVDQRIRITETVNGTTFTRFTGYVKQWPVAWPATVTTWATVQVMATDAQARAERRVLRSVMNEEVLADSPVAYYTLGEEAGVQTAADSSGNQASALFVAGSGADVVFGDPNAPVGTTAARFTDTTGKFLAATMPFDVAAGAFEFWFMPASLGSVGIHVIVEPQAEKTPSYSSFFGWAANTLVVGKPGAGTLNVTTLATGTLHHVVLTTAAGPTTQVYVDGNLVLTDSGLSAAVTALTVGNWQEGQYTFDGSVSHVAIYPSGLSAARIAAHYGAGLAAESSTARLTRLADYADLPLGTLDSSLTNVPAVDLTGKSAWEAIQQVVDAELGIAYFDGTGNLTFHNRNQVTTKTAPDLTIDKSYVTPDVQPVHDDQQIVNYIEATAEGTQVTQVARSTSSENLHGRYSDSKGYLVQTDAEALDRANWILSNLAEPTTRYGTLTVNLYAMPAATAALTLAALEIGAWLQITDMPSQNTGGGTVDLVVEGYSEQVTSSSWTVTLNVVSKYLFEAFVLDDTTRGVLGGGYRLYV